MNQTNAEFQSLTPAQFVEEATSLAEEIINKVLRPRTPLRTTVVMEALITLYCSHAESLPPEAKVDVAMALGGLAGEFFNSVPSLPQSAPAGTPTH